MTTGAAMLPVKRLIVETRMFEVFVGIAIGKDRNESKMSDGLAYIILQQKRSRPRPGEESGSHSC